MNDTNTTYDTAVRDADFDDFADSATAVTSDASDADEIATMLAQWWQTNARDLPWRFGRTTPWGVLVSEVMSQQTQMGRVVPYWTAWMDRWPDAAALADAPKSDVITAWGRLGYPRRALRLQECAHVIAYDYADELPHTMNCLLCPASVITRQARCCRSLSANVSRWSTRTSAVCCHVRSSASNRSAAAQVPRNARWRNGCCRTMIPRNAVVSIARPSCGTRPSWNSARRCALRNRHYAKPVRSPENARSYATEDRDWGSGVRDHANYSKVRTGRCAGWC